MEIDALLQEDTGVVKRRSAAQAAAKELEAAQSELHALQERRATGESPREAKVPVSARTLLLAGAFPLVPSNLLPRGMDPRKLYGEFTPLALVGEGVQPKLGPAVKRGGASEGAEKPAGEAAPVAAEPAVEPPGSAGRGAAAPAGRLPHRQPPPPPPRLGN